MIKPLGKARYGQPLRGARRLTRGPARCFGHIDRRKCLGALRRHHRHPAAELGGREARHIGPRHDVERDATGISEEHTSELQSLMRISYAVFCLTKKKRLITY